MHRILRVSIALALLVLMGFTLGDVSYAQVRKSASHRQASQQSNRSFRTNSRPTSSSRRINPELYKHSCYKIDAVLNGEDMPLNFVDSGSQWSQPGGPGEPFMLTYSYSNLLDGNMRGLDATQLRAAMEEAMAIWASVIPVNFVEVEDSGPDPTASETDYALGSSAQIRIGAHTIDGATGGELAHAFLPYSSTAGLAGDLHFDIDEDWGESDGGFFLETALHELGHVLGLDHENNVDAIMNPVIMNRFSGLGTGFLLNDDVSGVQSIYGSGLGSVTPLAVDPNDPPTDEPPTDEPPTDEPPTDEPPTDVPPTDNANDVAAELNTDTGLLSLTGDTEANSMMIFGSRWFTVVLGYNGTTINGETGMYWFDRSERSIDVVAGGGNDQVFFFCASASSVSVDLGAGDDLLAMIFSRLDSVDASGGDGNDTLFNIFNRIGGLTQSAIESVW